jgi:hypothetical protein
MATGSDNRGDSGLVESVGSMALGGVAGASVCSKLDLNVGEYEFLKDFVKVRSLPHRTSFVGVCAAVWWRCDAHESSHGVRIWTLMRPVPWLFLWSWLDVHPNRSKIDHIHDMCGCPIRHCGLRGSQRMILVRLPPSPSHQHCQQIQQHRPTTTATRFPSPVAVRPPPIFLVFTVHNQLKSDTKYVAACTSGYREVVLVGMLSKLKVDKSVKKYKMWVA